jgi:hypothetical protein
MSSYKSLVFYWTLTPKQKERETYVSITISSRELHNTPAQKCVLVHLSVAWLVEEAWGVLVA